MKADCSTPIWPSYWMHSPSRTIPDLRTLQFRSSSSQLTGRTPHARFPDHCPVNSHGELNRGRGVANTERTQICQSRSFRHRPRSRSRLNGDPWLWDRGDQGASGGGRHGPGPAELNGFAGPIHVLEAIRDGRLHLTSPQQRAVEQIHANMRRETKALGQKIPTAEAKLETGFRERWLTAASGAAPGPSPVASIDGRGHAARTD